MKLERKLSLGLAVALMAIALPQAKAEDSAAAAAPAATSTSSGLMDALAKNAKASYLMWLTGPNAQSLSGNIDGTGTNLSITHYATIGYKLSAKWSVSATQAMAQAIDNVPNEQQNPIRFTDPYITFTNNRIAGSDRYGTNLYGYLRYYVPVSRGTHDALNVGSQNDTGYGVARIYLNPSKTFMDGKLTVNGAVLANFKFAKLSNEERVRRGGPNFREDFYFILNPSVAYAITPKVEGYVEYATGYLRHTTNGKLSKLNHPTDGQYVSPGINWTPTKRLLLNPYASVGPKFQGVRNADFGLQAQYSFL